MSHQVTGYLLAMSTILDAPISNAVIHGLAIPQPVSRDFGGIERVPVTRSSQQFEEWVYWFIYSAYTYQYFKGHELDAPRWTHSCNRYFRPCSFIPLCYAPMDERVQMLDEMVDNTWNPLDEGNDD